MSYMVTQGEVGTEETDNCFDQEYCVGPNEVAAKGREKEN